MNNIKKYESLSWTGLSKLKIKLRQAGNNAEIFANGRNRIIVDIRIQPTDINGKSVSVPRDILLQNTWLIDYNSGDKLTKKANENQNFEWAYTEEPNEFITTPGISSSVQTQAEVAGGSTEEIVTFYVYCSPSEVTQVKQIAVLVQTPDKEYSTMYGEPFDSYVQLKAIGEIAYKYPHIKKEQGHIMNQNSITYHNNSSWEQANIYLSLDINDLYGKRVIKKLETEGGVVDNVHQLYHDDNGYRYYFAHFLWSLGKETAISIGNTEWFGLPITFPIDIKIRQKVGSLCFSILTVGDPSFPHLQDTWYRAFYFTLYDQYGNKGRFGLIPNNDNNTKKTDVDFAEA
ncbi:hypothetical protein [Xenorhabdus hominickii]|uniref:Uncharacterized protein n=1 Tax=Xenorhabdus hominickii TaxID=351679 RepID=A0A2G0QAP4_XENHO|nr:hypothetical protein [Xenorhabdus hominickii]AOM40765.1 hypothetical protein A9255_09265 [Xenorhabdus hominickii]PHM56286.1 hypothetical protein Xhom_01772 [Xenorhabdus hominickii]